MAHGVHRPLQRPSCGWVVRWRRAGVLGGMHQTTKYGYIDALRGYAVLLVITAHAGGMFPLLPYPLKSLTNFGVHGVQLFFLMSCVTLMLSWRSDEAKGRA